MSHTPLPGAAPFAAPGVGDRATTGVLVVHGLTATPQSMRPIFEHLAQAGYAVRAPLLPGHGTRWRDLAVTRYVDWFTAVEANAIELAATVDRVVVVGLSLGGALVTELAATRPDLVDAVVLINPAFAAKDPRLTLLPALRLLVPSLPGIGDDIRRPGGEREECFDRLPLKAFASFVSHWPQLLRLSERVHQPVLLVRSAHDKVVPAMSSEAFLERVGSSEVTEVVLPESGHVATLDYDADVLVARIEEFVARVAGQDEGS